MSRQNSSMWWIWGDCKRESKMSHSDSLGAFAKTVGMNGDINRIGEEFIREVVEGSCYNFSFLSLHRSSRDSFSCWTNFAPSFEDALRLNPAFLALRRAWPASIFLRTSFYFMCNVLYSLLLFYRTDHLSFISTLAFPLQTLLGPCAGSPRI